METSKGNGGLNQMKLTVHEQNQATLDTGEDPCLFQAPRGLKGSGYSRGKDLYQHPRKGLPPLYYLHRWSLQPGEREEITLISPIMAGRFLEARGLVCQDIGNQRASAILRSWGYGMLEEF
jgi:hypothetical protein